MLAIFFRLRVDGADTRMVYSCMDAGIIGDTGAEHAGRVVMKTCLGTSRIIDSLAGDIPPKI